MTNQSDEPTTGTTEAIDDDQLPADLQPEENPLAEGLEPGETAGDLLEDGKTPDPEQGEGSQDG